jgi:glycosyltransferase involved in cell wall biosynthesis
VSELSTNLKARGRVIAAGTGNTGERLDVLVHAAAQLPDSVRVEICASPDDVAQLRMLASAYAIEERVRIEPHVEERADATIVRTSSGTRPGARDGVSPRLLWDVRAPGSGQRNGEPVTTIAELLDSLYESGDPPASCRVRDDVLNGQRIALITNIPTHYRVALLNGIAKRLNLAGATLTVLFTGGARESTRPWLRHAPIEFDHTFLRFGGSRLGRKAPIDLGHELRRFQPTLLIAAGFSPMTAGRAVRYAVSHGVPLGIWSGEIHRQATARSRVRWLERRWILDRASFAISYGWLSREYLRDMAPKLPVVLGRNATPFFPGSPDGTDSPILEALAVAQAIPRKGLDVLVDAFSLLNDVPCRLTIAGGGAELNALIARAGSSERIRFLGAIDSDRVLDCYQQADLSLFPSRSDVFGLVLVEAMGSGLPTITAAAPGSVADLAVDGRNCLVVEGHDPRDWAAAIRRLVEDPSLRRELAGNGRETINRRWTMEHSVDAWVAACRLGLMQGAMELTQTE